MVTAAATQTDPRRISEADPDFQRVRSVWLRRLMASVRTLVSDIRARPQHIAAAQSAFIHRHTALLLQAYLAAHHAGQLDYWQAASNTPRKWLRLRPVQPSVAQQQRRLLFYAAASVTKLAREAEVAYTHSTQRTRPSSGAPSVQLADPPADLAFDQFGAWASPRIGLQVDITWSGFQDGYLDAASADMAGLRLQLWWDLEPAAQHCDDCSAVAAGSPYDAPGSGTGNELGQTPGDGNTACGAACKCSLRYGWTDLAGAGLGMPGDNELLLPPDETPTLAGGTPLPPGPVSPGAWEQARQAAIDQAMQAAGVSPQTPAGSEWLRRRDEALAAAGITDQSPLSPQSPQPPLSPEERARIEAIKSSPFATAFDREMVDSMLINGAVVRDIARSGPDLAPIEGLTTAQKQALDRVRGVALLWDAVRDQLPPFAQYFDPDSAGLNLWQNPDLTGLTETQRELVRRYFQALSDFQDALPLDPGDEPLDPADDPFAR